jgi:hypothetical protein
MGLDTNSPNLRIPQAKSTPYRKLIVRCRGNDPSAPSLLRARENDLYSRLHKAQDSGLPSTTFSCLSPDLYEAIE